MQTVIQVWTYFDCTATGVKGYVKSDSPDEWLYRRNQQRNWETLQQCISLRCQPLNLTTTSPNVYYDGHRVWCFCFETDRDEIFKLNDDVLGLLKQDCHGVPMIAGLDESWRESFLMPYLITHGDKQNIWFEII